MTEQHAEWLELIRQATHTRNTARQAFDNADRAWRTTIRDALTASTPTRHVSEAAHISHARVYQIRDNRR